MENQVVRQQRQQREKRHDEQEVVEQIDDSSREDIVIEDDEEQQQQPQEKENLLIEDDDDEEEEIIMDDAHEAVGEATREHQRSRKRTREASYSADDIYDDDDDDDDDSVDHGVEIDHIGEEEKDGETEEVEEEQSTSVVDGTGIHDDDDETPPKKRARKEKLNQFVMIDPEEVQVLREEVRQKEAMIEMLSSDLRKKENGLTQVTEDMYAAQQRRIALEIKRKSLSAQLKQVAREVEACARECDKMKLKVNVHESMVDRKKDQLKDVIAQCKQMKLELYEVELHNSMVSKSVGAAAAATATGAPSSRKTSTVRSGSSSSSSSSAANGEQLVVHVDSPPSPVTTTHKSTTPPTPPSNGQKSVGGHHKARRSSIATSHNRSTSGDVVPVSSPHSNKKQKSMMTEAVPPSSNYKQNGGHTESKQSETEKRRYDQLSSNVVEVEQTRRRNEESFISLNGGGSGSGGGIMNHGSRYRGQVVAQQQEQTVEEVDDLYDTVFQQKSIIYFLQDCGGRLLNMRFDAAEHKKQCDSFFVAVEDQIRIPQSPESPKSSTESTLSESSGGSSGSSGSSGKKSKTSSNLTPFTSYESPLNAFRTYRSTSLFPLTSAKNKPTASAAPPNVDYDRFLCRNDLDGRRCNDPNCTYQHMSDFEHRGSSGSKSTTFSRITDALKRSSQQKKISKASAGTKYAPGMKKRELRVLDDYLFDRNTRNIIANQAKTESRYYDKISSVEYENHLHQYPNDISYWIKYAMKRIIEFETNVSEGVKKALSILSKGLEQNPHSCDLWLVYNELYTSRLNTSFDKQALLDIFTSSEQKVHRSIFMWFKYVTSEDDLGSKIEIIDRAISVYVSDVELDKHQISRFITSLLYEKLRLLCQANRYDDAIKAVKSTYEPPMLTIGDDGDVGEKCDDISSFLLPNHKCNIWLIAIAITIARVFPFEEHIVGLDFLSLVDRFFAINFDGQQLSEAKRKEVSRLFDMALNMFPKTSESSGATNRDALPLLLNRHSFLARGSNSDFVLADQHFNELVTILERECAQSEQKFGPNQIPELLCFHLDCIENKFEGETSLNKIGQFYDMINGLATCNDDPYLWYKAILFFVQHSNFSRVNTSIWNYLNAYMGESLSPVTDNEQMLQDAIEIMKNLLDLPTTVAKNTYTRTMHYNVYAWMVYIALEVLNHQNVSTIRHIFEQAFAVFMNQWREKQWLLSEFVEFSRTSESRERYEEMIDMCLSQDSLCWGAMTQVETTIKLTREDPLLKALVFRMVVRDFSFHNTILNRFFDTSLESKLKGDLYECSLNTLQGDIELAIMCVLGHSFWFVSHRDVVCCCCHIGGGGGTMMTHTDQMWNILCLRSQEGRWGAGFWFTYPLCFSILTLHNLSLLCVSISISVYLYRWAIHEFREKNFNLAKVILYKLALVKPHAVNIWQMYGFLFTTDTTPTFSCLFVSLFGPKERDPCPRTIEFVIILFSFDFRYIILCIHDLCAYMHVCMHTYLRVSLSIVIMYI